MHLLKKGAAALLILILSATMGAARASEVTIPDTPAGQIAKKRFEAFNLGDADALRAYRDAHEPEMSIERELMMRQMLGGFELLSVALDEPHQVSLIVREQDGDRVGMLDLQVDPQQPTRVIRFGLAPMPVVPEALMPARLSESEAWQRVTDKALKLATQDQFAGVLAVGRDGKVRRSQAWGYADRARLLKADENTRYRMGSMYKMFTAVVILQLVEQGRLDLDAPLKRYLPDYPNPELASQVSIKHLLTHTGGTGDIFTKEYEQKRTDTREHSDYVRLFGARALDFAPGSREEYSNYGFVLLGAVIERVTGKSYHQNVQERIFKPARMTRTGAEPEERMSARISVGYTQGPDGLIDNSVMLPWRGTAAGGGYSTVVDMQRFGHALLSGRLLSPASLAQATQSQAPSGLYGFGFQLGGSGTTRHFGHAGGAEGMNGALRIYPASGDVLVSLSNLDPPAAESLVEYYGNRMPLAASRITQEGKTP